MRDARFEMRGGVARIVPDPPVSLATPSTDPAMAVSAGVATAKEPVGVARILFRGTPVAPYRCYHLSFEVRTPRGTFHVRYQNYLSSYALCVH